VDGHLPSLSTIFNIADTLVDNLLNRESSPNMCSLFSVLGVDQIPVVQSSGRSDNAGVLAERSHVERYFA
jgi:hypothetical protein